MKPAPKDWPRISSALYYEDAPAAIDWLCRAFGFEVRVKIEGEGGRIEHSELTYGEGLIMVGQAGLAHKPSYRKSPRSLDGANTQNMMVYVDDIETHCDQARKAGAKSFRSHKRLITEKSGGPIAVMNAKISRAITGGLLSG